MDLEVCPKDKDNKILSYIAESEDQQASKHGTFYEYANKATLICMLSIKCIVEPMMACTDRNKIKSLFS